MANETDSDQPVKLPANDDDDTAVEGDDTVVAEDEHDDADDGDDDDDDDDDDSENVPAATPATATAGAQGTSGGAAAGSGSNTPAAAQEYVWKIENWSRTDLRIYSEPFTAGSFEWRMLAFPRGNNVDSLSLFLEVYNHQALPASWHRSAHFTLTLRNQRFPERSQSRDETHVFFSREADWGFQQFIKLRDLNDEAQGYCLNDTVIITAQVQVLTDQELAGRKVAGNWQRFLPPYDSKKETGFVGLKNQGATCYMNSLLQALYHLGSFRRAVYQMPTDNEENPEKSIPLALQRVFYRLQFSDQGVSTKELTKSFGWDAYDSFTQHDIQELNRVLCDNLEGKMKSTPAEGTIERHFQGKLVSFIKCVNVDFESTREEAFYDLSLNVKDVKDLYASFQKYVEVEMLDGANQYMAEGHGLQDAKMGCRIKSLPPVLELQLKRFEYNPMVDGMCKINDKFIFPPEIDLSDFLAEDADRSHPPIYHLYAVLVHSGDVHGGHYYAFIKPTTGPQWYKFDDDRVTAVTAENAIDDNFGGEQLLTTTNFRGERIVMKHKKYANAYMLIYVRAQDIDEILGPVTGDDIPSYLRDIFEGEAAKDEQKRKDKAEAHLYVNIKPTFAENYLEANTDPFELLDISKERTSFRVKKTSTLAEFKQVLIKEHLPNVVPERIRFWAWVARDNKTVRPQRLITPAEENKPISYIRQSSMDDWKLYVEVGPEVADEDGSFFPSGNLTFFKFYDPETQAISRVGTAIIDEHKYLHEILETMRKLKGLPDGCSLECFEELKPGQVEPIRPDQTLGAQRLGAGDIIIFQLSPPEDQLDTSSRFGLAPNYLNYLFNRITIECYSYEKPAEKQFEIELSKKDPYQTVSHAITAKLNLPDFHVRFYPHSGLQGPRRSAIKYSPVLTLSEMLTSMYSRNITPIIYFEALECDVRELESKKSLKLAFLDDGNKLIGEVRVLVPKDAKMSQVIQAAKEKLPEPIDPSVPYRACDTFSNRISRIFRDTESVNLIDEQNVIIAEPIGAIEAEFKPGDRLIPVCHAQLEGSIVRPFGFPFMFPLFATEQFAATKARLQAKLQVEDQEFAKWKFGVASFGALISIQDTDILAKRDFASMTFLAMLHTNKNAKTESRYRRAEKAIKIYN